MKSSTVLLAAATVTILLMPHAVCAQTRNLFSDNFDYTNGETDQNFELQSDQQKRQSGTLAPASYRERGSNRNGAVQLYLSTDEAYDHGEHGRNGVLVLRSLDGSNGSLAVASNVATLDKDLGPAVAGKQWTASFTAVLRDAQFPNTPTSWFAAFVVGQNNTDACEPTQPGADFAFQIDYNGSFSVLADQQVVGSGTIAGFALSSPLDIVIAFNEAGPHGPEATVSVDARGRGAKTLGTYPFKYTAQAKGRYVSFVNRILENSTTNSADNFSDYVDLQVDNLALGLGLAHLASPSP
jgi:hypothetical protein